MFSSRSFAYDSFGGYQSRYNYDGGLNRGSFASVSERAVANQETAQKLFLDHLATVDVSQGPVTAEIIKFHLVPDMKSRFNRFVKDHGCTATSRKLTREEQDKINKTRKSLMIYTSVTITPDAQRSYIEKNPDAAKKAVAAKNAAQAVASSSSGEGPLTESKNKKRKANQAELTPPAESKKAKR